MQRYVIADDFGRRVNTIFWDIREAEEGRRTPDSCNGCPLGNPRGPLETSLQSGVQFLEMTSGFV